MDELILRKLRGEASPFELERLRRWRSENPRHEAHYRAMERIWGLSEPELPGAPPAQDLEALEATILQVSAERRGDAVLPFHCRATVRRLALAGTVLAAGVAAITVGIRAEGNAPAPLPTDPTASVASTEPQTLQLDDGSYVRLAAGSRLDVRFRNDRREVVLHGRAFFAVAPDAGRPFLVHTEGARVRVLGTRFEVAEGEAGTRTVVVEGRVSLASERGAVEVPAGSVGNASRSARPVARVVTDPWALMDWPGGLLVFHETPLRSVIREVESHFGLPVRFEGSLSDQRRVSASFQEEESFREVLETLCAVTATSCRITPDSAVITSDTGEGR